MLSKMMPILMQRVQALWRPNRKGVTMRLLDPNKNSPEVAGLVQTFDRLIVGQSEAKTVLANMVEQYQSGFVDPERPAGNVLFLGGTGTGKTATIQALAEGLFGDKRAMIKIDCAEYQHGHEIAKLIGSPPGYLGHRETHPLLTQEALDQFHSDKLKLSILLFDEIEKSSDTLWNLLLGILDKATVTLGDNRRVDFRQVIIAMTSNLGSSQMERLATGGMGFSAPEVQTAILDSQLDTVAKDAAKRKFSPEFFNRLNHITVFKSLTPEMVESILDMEIAKLHERFLFGSKVQFYFHVRKSAKAAILKEGYNRVYGARFLQRALERSVVTPLSRLVASGQVLKNDTIIIDTTPTGEFRFYSEENILG
jgi:ATP-dependent Clp protease ATP-binding subunit ClpB